MMKKAVGILTLALAVLAAQSCKKQTIGNTVSSNDYAYSKVAGNDLGNIAKEAIQYAVVNPNGKSGVNSNFISSCATVTVVPAWPDTTFPKDITIDFGQGCVGGDGRLRKGILSIHTTGKYRTPGAQWAISTQNYSVDQIEIEGVKEVTNNGFNSDGNLTYTVVTELSNVLRPDGKFFKYESVLQREWVEGYGTSLIADGAGGLYDDVYWITGSGSGVNSDDRLFNVTIMQKLVVELSCTHIVSGTINIQPQGLTDRVLDYGSGNCDDQATVTIGSNVYPITLH